MTIFSHESHNILNTKIYDICIVKTLTDQWPFNLICLRSHIVKRFVIAFYESEYLYKYSNTYEK